MGCPDWPKCFGSWVPPTEVSQLPADYKEKFAERREQKNIKFARYLRVLGMNKTADQLVTDQSVATETEFNPVKTWIEYINRLLGVTIGLLVVVLFVRSWSYRKQQPVLFGVSAVALITVIFQGWFGSIVVSTNLTVWTITVHMLLALVLVAMLVYLLHVSEGFPSVVGPRARVWLLAVCIAALLVQIFLGTEVRGVIDGLMNKWPREHWVEQLGLSFVVHRSFSWLVLVLNTILFFQIRKTNGSKTLSLALFLLILCSLATGAGLAYLNMPALIQPLHLLLASVALGVQVLLLLRMNQRPVVEIK